MGVITLNALSARRAIHANTPYPLDVSCRRFLIVLYRTIALIAVHCGKEFAVQIRLDQLAELVGGNLIGDPSHVCSGANPPEQSTRDQVTLIVNPDRHEELASVQAVAIVTPREIPTIEIAQIVAADPHAAFAKAVAHFRPPIQPTLPGVGVDSTASIASSAKVHPTATVCEGVTIGERTLLLPGVVVMPGCEIGDDCILHPGVTLYEYTQLGDRVRVHAGTVIGANGFGYRQENGRHLPSAQLGYVEVGCDVEIGACVTIDRGTYGATTIGEGTKIDNQVMIAHNCRIGRHNLLCSQVGIAGSCSTGDYVIMAGQVGLKDHIHVGDRAIVGAQAGVMDHCLADQVYLGSPAMVQRDQMQIFAVERKLPEMRRELKALRKQVALLTQQLGDTNGEAGEECRAA